MLKPILCLLGVLLLLLILSHAYKRPRIMIVKEQVPVQVPTVPVQIPVLIEKVRNPGPLRDDTSSMYYSDLEWYGEKPARTREYTPALLGRGQPLYSNKRPFSSNYYNGSYKTYTM